MYIMIVTLLATLIYPYINTIILISQILWHIRICFDLNPRVKGPREGGSSSDKLRTLAQPTAPHKAHPEGTRAAAPSGLSWVARVDGVVGMLGV